MNSIQRTRGIRKALKTGLLGKSIPKYVTSGDRACGRMMCEARQRRIPGPSDQAILARAQLDLMREILGGYWQHSAA